MSVAKRVPKLLDKAAAWFAAAPEEASEPTQEELFELVLSRLTRFARSGITDRDALYDIAVCCFMLAAKIEESD
jgi:hypothetical protein